MKILLFVFFYYATPLLTISQVTKLEVLDFTKSVCEPDSNSRKQIRERIIESEFNSNSYRLQIGVWALCCLDYKPSANLRRDSLFLDIEDTKKENPCECSCYYYFTYKIMGLKSEPLKIIYKDRPITLSNERYQNFPPSYEVINGDTLNRKDKYGLRQGRWASDNKWNNWPFIKEYFVYKDGLISSKVELYTNGKIQSEKISEIVKKKNNESNYGDKLIIVEYYYSGAKKKECLLNFKERGICKEWDEQGNLTYDGNFKK